MKVVQLNTSDTGGAGIAAVRLHRALLQQGVDSVFFSRWQRSTNEQQFSIGESKPNWLIRLLSKFGFALTKDAIAKKVLSKKSGNYEIFTFPQTDCRAEQYPLVQQADLLNLHWVSWFINYPTFFKIHKPIVWTFHDFNPLMGGFHYPADNDRNRENFGLLEDSLRHQKQYFLRQRNANNLSIVTPSKWLGEYVQKSEIFKRFNVTVIPNSIDTTVFKPYDQPFARSVFNLPPAKKIILFVSETVDNYRKGFDLLFESINRLNMDNSCVLVTVGNAQSPLTPSGNIINIGSINDERLMALLYSAADAFILPSREDNLPNVMLESIACGTPVIAFRTGGIPEAITSGFNGILANEISVDALTETIKRFIENEFHFNSAEIRKHAVEHFSPERQAAAYHQVYTRLMENFTRNES
jgi:glycosyltransferase involved in cell wall biosynthesis